MLAFRVQTALEIELNAPVVSSRRGGRSVEDAREQIEKAYALPSSVVNRSDVDDLLTRAETDDNSITVIEIDRLRDDVGPSTTPTCRPSPRSRMRQAGRSTPSAT